MPSSALISTVRLISSASSVVARLDRRALHELQFPAMRVLERGVAAVEQRAQEIERRRRLAVGLELPARIGNARLRP